MSRSGNLRWVSSQLATAVRTAQVTTSTAIAQVLGNGGGKSVRRRLYDSLKVLQAAGAISRGRRGDKTVRWMGTSHLSMHGSARIRVEMKRNRRDALISRLLLAKRNQRVEPTTDGKIKLPFVVVRTLPNARIALTGSTDASSLVFRLDSYFEVLNDAALIARIAPS